MKLKTPGKTVLVSPFFNYKLGYLSVWPTAVKTIFTGTKVNILALQDGVNYNTSSQILSIFTNTKKGTDAAGMLLYANNETYALDTAENGITASQTRITSQMAAVNKFVKGYVAFSIHHY